MSTIANNPFLEIPYEITQHIIGFLPRKDKIKLLEVDHFLHSNTLAQAELSNAAAVDAYKEGRLSFTSLLSQIAEGQLGPLPTGVKTPSVILQEAHSPTVVPRHLSGNLRMHPEFEDIHYYDQLFHKAISIASAKLNYDQLDTEEKKLEAGRLAVFLLLDQAHLENCSSGKVDLYLSNWIITHNNPQKTLLVPVYLEGAQKLVQVVVNQANFFSTMIESHDPVPAYLQMQRLDSASRTDFISSLEGKNNPSEDTQALFVLLDELAHFALAEYGTDSNVCLSQTTNLAGSEFHSYVRSSTSAHEVFSRALLWEAQKLADYGLLNADFFNYNKDFTPICAILNRSTCFDIIKNATRTNNFQINLGNHIEFPCGTLLSYSSNENVQKIPLPHGFYEGSSEKETVVDLNKAKELMDHLHPEELALAEAKLCSEPLKQLYGIRKIDQSAIQKFDQEIKERVAALPEERKKMVEELESMLIQFSQSGSNQRLLNSTLYQVEGLVHLPVGAIPTPIHFFRSSNDVDEASGV